MTKDLILLAVSEVGGSSEMKAAIIGGLVGSLLGGGLASLVAWQAHKHDLKLEQIQNRKRIDGILLAIRYEIETLREFYEQDIGAMLKELPEGVAFDSHFRMMTEKYFIVYPNNTEIVGQIADSDLVKSIVVTYNKANFLIEGLHMNNWYLDSKKELEKSVSILKQELASLQRQRIDHAKLLKTSQDDLVAEAKNLVAKIDGYRHRYPTPRG